MLKNGLKKNNLETVGNLLGECRLLPSIGFVFIIKPQSLGQSVAQQRHNINGYSTLQSWMWVPICCLCSAFRHSH